MADGICGGKQRDKSKAGSNQISRGLGEFLADEKTEERTNDNGGDVKCCTETDEHPLRLPTDRCMTLVLQ